MQPTLEQTGKERIRIIDQQRTRAMLHNPTIAQDQHLVGPLDRPQSVRDDNRRPIFEQPINRAVDQPLGRRVEPG